MPKSRPFIDEVTLTDEVVENFRACKGWVEARMLELYDLEEALKAERKVVPRSLQREGRRLAAQARDIDELLARHAMIAIDAAAASEVAAAGHADL